MESSIVSKSFNNPVAERDYAFPLNNNIQRVSLLGLRFHCLSLSETIQVIDQFIIERRPRQICLSNAYTLALSRHDSQFADILNHADLLLADGMSVVWGARWVSVRLPGRVAGPDLMEALCTRAPSHGHRIFLLGSSSENLERLAHTLKERTPDLTIVGTYSPPMCEQIDPAENEKIFSLLDETHPDILFVGLSAPKQEKWISDNIHRLHVPACLGVGAAFDFLSGRIPRAPRWMQTVGLEWLHRLGCEPSRLWRRYVLGNIVFLSLLLKELFVYKLSRLRTVLHR